MSEPMPGAVPAQQDADPARAAGAGEPAEKTAPAEQAEAVAGELPGAHGPVEAEHRAGAEDNTGAEEHADAEEPAQPGEAEAEDDGPRPLGLHVEPTGQAPVDAQLRRLEDADHLAVSGHLEVYEDVHRGLREALAGLDRHPASAPAPGPASVPAPGPASVPAPGPASVHAPGPASVHGPGRPAPGPQPHRS